MTVPAEFLYESCTCESGMRNGQRCADCGGRGIVPAGTKPTGASIPEAALVDDDGELDGLEDMSVTHLRSRAKDLGLATGGTKAALIAAIRAASAPDEDEDAAHTASNEDTDEESEA